MRCKILKGNGSVEEIDIEEFNGKDEVVCVEDD